MDMKFDVSVHLNNALTQNLVLASSAIFGANVLLRFLQIQFSQLSHLRGCQMTSMIDFAKGG